MSRLLKPASSQFAGATFRYGARVQRLQARADQAEKVVDAAAQEKQREDRRDGDESQDEGVFGQTLTGMIWAPRSRVHSGLLECD
jgi:hypothetical protein